MSSVFKGVKKVFKKVAKVVKKVLPYILLAAAVIFTAGAAIAAIPGAAGTGIFAWSGKLTAFIGTKFGTGALGSIVSGAVSKGIIGTAIGGLTAAATGGDIKKGMLIGGLGGLVTGGVLGAINAPAAAATAAPAAAPAATPGLNTGFGSTPTTAATAAAAAPAAAPTSTLTSAAKAASTAPRVVGTSGVMGKVGLLPPPTPWKDLTAMGKLGRTIQVGSNNQAVVGAIGGAAKAVLTGDDGRERAARIDAEDAAQARGEIRANYGTGGQGLLTAQQQQALAAAPSTGLASRWAWDPDKRAITLQPA